MRAAAIVGLIVAFGSPAALGHVVRHANIADSFWGRWAPSEEACTKVGETVIEMAAKRYVSPKASCSVDWVSETAGRAGPIYSAHLQCSRGANDARPTISNVVFFLKGTDQLSIGADFSKLEIYRRCPDRTRKATP
jgi:hypothetical protein